MSASERRERTRREIDALRAGGREIAPIEPFRGQKLARTFWGQAWCRHIECLSDFASRLSKGKTYVRNGSVAHLAIAAGRVEAIVAGTELYEVSVEIDPIDPARWDSIKRRCAGHVGSAVELLQGKFSNDVMAILTDPDEGMFPHADDFRLDCSCPDFARLCKHLAAVLYGVGARLDERPELLFALRGVDHVELIEAATSAPVSPGAPPAQGDLNADDLADIFGVEIAPITPPAAPKRPRRRAK